MKKPKVSTAGSSAQPRLFVERRLCKTDAQRGCLHEHCRSDHELRSQDTARRRERLANDVHPIRSLVDPSRLHEIFTRN